MKRKDLRCGLRRRSPDAAILFWHVALGWSLCLSGPQFPCLQIGQAILRSARGQGSCFLSTCSEHSTLRQGSQADCVLESQTLILLQNHVQSGQFNPLRAGTGGTGGGPVSSKCASGCLRNKAQLGARDGPLCLSSDRRAWWWGTSRSRPPTGWALSHAGRCREDEVAASG